MTKKEREREREKERERESHPFGDYIRFRSAIARLGLISNDVELVSLQKEREEAAILMIVRLKETIQEAQWLAISRGDELSFVIIWGSLWCLTL